MAVVVAGLQLSASSAAFGHHYRKPLRKPYCLQLFKSQSMMQATATEATASMSSLNPAYEIDAHSLSLSLSYTFVARKC